MVKHTPDEKAPKKISQLLLLGSQHSPRKQSADRSLGRASGKGLPGDAKQELTQAAWKGGMHSFRCKK